MNGVMNEQQSMLSEMVDGLFAELGHTATLSVPGGGDSWSRVEELALPSLMVAEDQGGFGGTWDDARLVFRLAGYHALALPVVEAILAQSVAGAREGRGTVASASEGTLVAGRFTGTVTGAVQSEGAEYIVAPAPDGGSMVLATSAGTLSPRATLSGEARDEWRFDNAEATTAEADIVRLGAFARAAQIGGALDAALAMSVAYANERKQFGKPLGKFQAVQQNLATFAVEAAAANCAAVGAAQALDRGAGAFEVAAAKLRANRAAGTGTSLAHQAHGAIGFTHEYGLHPLTRRMWTWRSEFGGDSRWAAVIGAEVAAAGAEAFWPNLTALTD